MGLIFKNVKIANNEIRKFSGSELENGIKFVNIEDPNIETSYLIVSVGAGSLNEPFENQGLAHFLEHMLFLGSKKFPKENHLDEFLNKNGGFNNAYTDNFETVYYISVNNEAFEEGMDILSRFFIDPLFSKGSVDREINAIDSEHMKNIQSDFWRIDHFFNIISKKDSSVNKFFTGNLESLQKKGLRDDMINFYNKHYVSSKITVSTISSISNSKTASLIQKYFSQVPVRVEGKQNKIEKPFYNDFEEFYYLQSINNVKMIIYLWEAPMFKDYYYNDLSPYYISDIINDDSEKSISQFLIKKGLIKYIRMQYLDDGKFIVSIELNNFNDWNLVDSYFKYFLNEIKTLDWEKITKYQIKRDMLLYNISPRAESIDLAQKIANNLHIYSIEDSDFATNYSKEINMDKIYEILNDILDFKKVKIIFTGNEEYPDINNVFWSKKEHEVEKYYGLKYSKINLNFEEPIKFNFVVESNNQYLNIKPTLIKNLNESFPKANSFSNLKSKYNVLRRCLESIYPFNAKIDDSKNNYLDIWFGNLSEFNEAIVYTSTIVSNLIFTNSKENFLLYKLLIQYINYLLILKFNLEKEVGYSSYFTFNIKGQILINISGWNSKFENYFNDVCKFLSEIKTFNSDYLKVLETMVIDYDESYQSKNNLNPWKYLDNRINIQVYKSLFDDDEILNLINTDKKKEILINKFILDFEILSNTLKNSKSKFFIFGNIDESILCKIKSNLVKDQDQYKSNNLPVSMIEKFDIFHPNPNEESNCVAIYYYQGKFSLKNNSLLNLFVNLVNQRFYDSLRTKQQFGYLVRSYSKRVENEYYFVQKVQSNRSPEEIIDAIKKFNKQFLENLDNYIKSDFDDIKNSLINDLNEPENRTSDYFNLFLEEIIRNEFIFDRLYKIIDELKKVTSKELVKYSYKLLGKIDDNNNKPIVTIIRKK